jgi:MFS family permease
VITLVVTGFFNIAFSATANSTVQINSKDEFRGRVMSVYALVFGGTTPIGNMISGLVANNVGPRAGFILNGAITLTLILVLLSFKKRSEKKMLQANSLLTFHAVE